jgi:hypothetical protein
LKRADGGCIKVRHLSIGVESLIRKSLEKKVLKDNNRWLTDRTKDCEVEVYIPEPPPVITATRPLTEKREEGDRLDSMFT